MKKFLRTVCDLVFGIDPRPSRYTSRRPFHLPDSANDPIFFDTVDFDAAEKIYNEGTAHLHPVRLSKDGVFFENIDFDAVDAIYKAKKWTRSFTPSKDGLHFTASCIDACQDGKLRQNTVFAADGIHFTSAAADAADKAYDKRDLYGNAGFPKPARPVHITGQDIAEGMKTYDSIHLAQDHSLPQRPVLEAFIKLKNAFYCHRPLFSK